MLLLAVETSTARSSIALVTADGVLAAAELGRDRRHGEFVAPAIAEALHHAGATVADITAVAASTGPGLYTGLRVGLVTAATIAATHDLPCVAVPGPAVLAHRARHTERLIGVVLDARRKEVYLGIFTPGAAGATLRAPLRVLQPADAVDVLVADGAPLLLVGDGTAAVIPLLAAHPGDLDVTEGGPDLAQPLAADLGLLAVRSVLAGDVHGPEVLRPVYLRDADAKIGWDARGRLQGGAAT
ncbi:MAG: tRNA threonylcarbamoyladenosine biosynthesis protein TsaB [Myxococcota bacterium]|jgi:tRNA threonylcarbamoyladenosine biosynthesis protein TsaB